MNPTQMLIGAGIGGLTGFLSPDQQGAYNQYASDVSNIANQYAPYEKIGKGSMYAYGLGNAMSMIDPTLLQNRVASSYNMSPYQQQMMQNTTAQMNANAAQTGMLGSTAQQAALQDALASQQNQWEQQYINRGMGQYNRGMQGMYNLANLGFQGMGRETRLENEAALGRLRANLAPSQAENIFTDAAGGAMGLL